MHVLIWYWTGTGNTARAAGILARTLESKGWTADCREVRHDSPVPTAQEREGADLVVAACPALGFSAPAHFLAWLARWPQGKGGRAAVLGVGGAEGGPGGTVPGWTGHLLHQVAGRLRARGFTVVSASDLSYPVNWTQVLAPLAPGVQESVLAASDQAAAAWAAALADGTAPAFRGLGAGRRAVAPVGWLFRLVARRFLGKLYAADGSCTACGLCARTCPAGVIRMDGPRPVWNLSCDACNRCINLCPTASIQTSLARLLVHGLGNLVLLAAGIALALGDRPAEGAALYLGGSLVQLTAVDALWSRLERRPAWAAVLTWGWTRNWGRYKAPGFRPGAVRRD